LAASVLTRLLRLPLPELLPLYGGVATLPKPLMIHPQEHTFVFVTADLSSGVSLVRQVIAMPSAIKPSVHYFFETK